MKTTPAISFLAALTLSAGAARAYTVSSLITYGCHESLTSSALRQVRTELGTAAPLPATDQERAMIADLQFTPDVDMRDLGAASLLIGVRDNDLKAGSATDLSQLALVQGDPDAQHEHCLRDLGEKEPGGSEIAVAVCRDFILQRVQQAIAGLDANGMPDLTNRTELPIHLALRGDVYVNLPTFYLRIGQAMHAVEDSFTHTYRTPDGTQITAVLDWLDEVDGSLDEEHDGPAHSGEMDRCDDPDELRHTRRLQATSAATSVLRIALTPSQTPEEKLVAVQGVLDQYLTFVPGCTYDNHWCNAVEHQYGNVPLFSCASTGPQGSAFLGWFAALAFLAWQLRPRARKSRVPARAMFLVALLAALPLAARAADSPANPGDDKGAADGGTPAATDGGTKAPLPHTVSADGDKIIKSNGPPSKEPENDHKPPPPKTRPVPEPGPRDPSAFTFGGFAGASGSVNNGALAFELGGRLRVSSTWTFGLDAEFNPWLSYNGEAIRAGVFNVYGSVIHRLPLAYEQFNLRTTASLGVSRLLIDLYGAPNGSTGVFFAFAPLGLEWKLSRYFYLIINPLNFAYPVPQLKGVPFGYPQYRATIGFEFYTR